MVRMQRMLVGIALMLAVVAVSAAQGFQATGKTPATDTKQPTTKTKTPASETKQPVAKGKVEAPSNRLEIKTFELANANVEAVRQTLTTLWPQMAAMRGVRPGQPAVPPRIAVNARTHMLFVRGMEKDIDAIADLISILDAPADKPLPSSKGMKAVRLRHAKVPEVLSILSGLGLQTHVVPLAERNILLLPHSDDHKEVLLVIDALDVDKSAKGKPPTKTTGKTTTSRN